MDRTDPAPEVVIVAKALALEYAQRMWFGSQSLKDHQHYAETRWRNHERAATAVIAALHLAEIIAEQQKVVQVLKALYDLPDTPQDAKNLIAHTIAPAGKITEEDMTWARETIAEIERKTP